MSCKKIFKSHVEFINLTRTLPKVYKKKLLNNLCDFEKKQILKKIESERWNDLVDRNEIGEIIDQLEKEFGYNLIHIRFQILNGKNILVDKNFWDAVEGSLSGYSLQSKHYVIGDIIAKEQDNNLILLIGVNNL